MGLFSFAQWKDTEYRAVNNILCIIPNILLAPIVVGSTPFIKIWQIHQTTQKSNCDQLLPNDDLLSTSVGSTSLYTEKKLNICAVTFYNRMYNFWWKRSRLTMPMDMRCKFIAYSFHRWNSIFNESSSTNAQTWIMQMNRTKDVFLLSAIQGMESPIKIKIEVLCESEKATT